MIGVRLSIADGTEQTSHTSSVHLIGLVLLSPTKGTELEIGSEPFS